MTIAKVGTEVKNNAFAASVAFAKTTTAGNALVLCLLHQSTTATITISDTGGNTWIRGATTFGNGGASEGVVSIYYCLNANAVTSVTASASASIALIGTLSEWSGVGSFGAGNQSYVSTNQTAPAMCGVAVNSGDVAIGVAGYYSSTSARYDTVSSPGVALVSGTQTTSFETAAYIVATSTGTLGPTWTNSPAAYRWGTATISFVPAATPTVATATFNFDTNPTLDTPPWASVAATNVTMTWNSTDKAIQARRAGRNQAAAQSYWQWSGTWEQLGVPVGATVTSIKLKSGWTRVTEYNVGAAGTVGPYELRDAAGTTLLGTLWAGRSFTAVDVGTAIAAQTAVTVATAQQPSNTTVKIRLADTLATGNNNSAAVTSQDDSVVLEIAYTPYVEPPPSTDFVGFGIPL